MSNPFHFLTLSFSGLLLLLPWFSPRGFVWVDGAMCLAIAVSMLILGCRLAFAQGRMLLMSHSGRPPADHPKQAGTDSSVSDVVREIASEPNISRVEEAQFWQVHYGLCMASLKVCVVRGCDDSSLSQLRTRVARVIQSRLGEGYGRGGSLRWEVTMQTSTDGG